MGMVEEKENVGKENVNQQKRKWESCKKNDNK